MTHILAAKIDDVYYSMRGAAAAIRYATVRVRYIYYIEYSRTIYDMSMINCWFSHSKRGKKHRELYGGYYLSAVAAYCGRHARSIHLTQELEDECDNNIVCYNVHVIDPYSSSAL